MPVFFSSLNSGSNGNCYYIGNDREAVLIDAGISCREILRRMNSCQLDIKKVKAVIISHEHSDHIKGVETLSQKFNLPVYITDKTATHSGLRLNKSLQKSFSPAEKITIGELEIESFKKHHDAADPHSFVVSTEGMNVGVFTDIGFACDALKSRFSSCHAAFLEANYDRTMLENGNYPFFLKKRITGGMGHLSNDEALEVFKKFRSPSLQYLLLSHLSKDNNCPAKVSELFSRHAGKTRVSIASRYMQSPVYSISGTAQLFRPVQLTMF